MLEYIFFYFTYSYLTEHSLSQTSHDINLGREIFNNNAMDKSKIMTNSNSNDGIDKNQIKTLKNSYLKYKRNVPDMGQNDDDPIPYETNLLEDTNALIQILKMKEYEPENLPLAQRLYFYIEKILPGKSYLSLINILRPEPEMILEIKRVRSLILLKAELKRLETITRLNVVDYKAIKSVISNLDSPKKEYYMIWYDDMMSKDYKYENVFRNLQDIYIFLHNMQIEHKNSATIVQEFH